MNNITWESVMGDIRTLLAEYYQDNPPAEVMTVDDSDVIASNIEEYVDNLEAREVLEKVIQSKLYLEY